MVVTGLPVTIMPKTGDSNNDRQEFLRLGGLGEENLNIKPLVTEHDCVRIGNSQPRKLLVRLHSNATATAVRQNAASLKPSQSQQVSQNIFINLDLYPATAKLAFEARKFRREESTVDSMLLSQPITRPSLL